MKKTKILYVFHVSAIGGGSFCLLNMIKVLDTEKFEAVVCLKSKGPLVDELNKLGVKAIIKPFLNTVPYNRSLMRYSSIKQILLFLFSMRKFKMFIKELNPDIVHLNTMMMHPYAIAAKKNRSKVVVHAREHWPINENALQLKLARSIIKKYSDKIIAINKTTANILNLPLKTVIVYDWIDFEDREKAIPFRLLFGEKHDELKVLLFLGGLQKIKGSLDIAIFFNEVISNKDLRLLIVGGNSKEIDYSGMKGILKRTMKLFNFYSYSDKIKRIAQKDDRIVLIPPSHQVKSLFEQSYCTIAYPTVPHAILPIAEAIFLGKPVLSARTQEALEYSNEGKGATLFELNNKEDFLLKLKYVLESSEEIEQNALDSCEYIKEVFSKENNALILNNTYKTLV